MFGRLKAICKSLPLDLSLWAAMTMVLAFAFVTSVVMIFTLPGEETRYANSYRQRVIIDPATGIVSNSGDNKKSPAFDVGSSNNASAAPDIGKSRPLDTTEPPSPVAVAATAMPKNLPKLQTTPETTQFPEVARTASSLVRAPAPDITEKEGDLLLPKRSTGSGSAASIYSRGFTRYQNSKHLLAVVVTDIGYSPDVLKETLTLPKDTSIAISPYALNPAQQIEAIRNAGFEVWTMLAAEEDRYPEDDPGPLGILNTMSNAEMLGRLHMMMSNTQGSVGMILPPGQLISKSEKLWRALRSELEQRGMLLLLTHLTPETQTLAGDMTQLNARLADAVIDPSSNQSMVRSKLSQLLDQVKSQRVTIIVISARPQTLGALREWLNALPVNVTFAPLSAIYREEFKALEAGMSDKEREEKLIERRTH